MVDAGVAVPPEQPVGHGPLDAPHRQVGQLQQAPARGAPHEVLAEHRPHLVELREHGGHRRVLLGARDAAQRGQTLDGDDQGGDLGLAQEPAQAAQRGERIGGELATARRDGRAADDDASAQALGGRRSGRGEEGWQQAGGTAHDVADGGRPGDRVDGPATGEAARGRDVDGPVRPLAVVEVADAQATSRG